VDRTGSELCTLVDFGIVFIVWIQLP